jgi:hypothetical protein
MERPLFVARDPSVFAIQPGPPREGRIFVTDQSRWYERLKDDNGNPYFAHVADSDDAFHQAMVEQNELTPVVELDVDDSMTAVALDEFMQTGFLVPEVPVIEDIAA